MPYVVTYPITHLGKNYAVGDAIEPMPHEIGQLLNARCIKEVPPLVPPFDPPVFCSGVERGGANPLESGQAGPINGPLPSAPKVKA